MRAFKAMTLGMGFLALTGCGADRPVAAPEQPSAPPEVRAPLPNDGSLQTDKATYTATCQGEGYSQSCSVTLELTYTNQTDATVYFDHCFPEDTSPIYSVRGLTQEESAYSPYWGCVGHDRSVEVLAGKTRTDTFEVSGPNAWDGQTGEPFGVLEGRLQILYTAHTCASEGNTGGYGACELPDETATSNIFTVNLPD